MGLKVIGGTHREALRLWLNGIKLMDRPHRSLISARHSPEKQTLGARGDDDAQTFWPSA
jgi:DUF1365 family protein